MHSSSIVPSGRFLDSELTGANLNGRFALPEVAFETRRLTPMFSSPNNHDDDIRYARLALQGMTRNARSDSHSSGPHGPKRYVSAC